GQSIDGGPEPRRARQDAHRVGPESRGRADRDGRDPGAPGRRARFLARRFCRRTRLYAERHAASRRRDDQDRGVSAVKVLLTGAAGFIGRYVLRELLARGHEVRALDSLRSDVHADPGWTPPGRATVERG